MCVVVGGMDAHLKRCMHNFTFKSRSRGVYLLWVLGIHPACKLVRWRCDFRQQLGVQARSAFHTPRASDCSMRDLVTKLISLWCAQRF